MPPLYIAPQSFFDKRTHQRKAKASLIWLAQLAPFLLRCTHSTLHCHCLYFPSCLTQTKNTTTQGILLILCTVDYMGIQEVKKLHQRRHDKRVEDHQDGDRKVWVLAAGLTLPLQQLKPIKTGRRRHGQATAKEEERGEEEEVEEAVTPKGKGCRIPAEAETCPPAPKKPRTAVLLRDSRRCNCDGEALEFYRVPADLEAVFVSRAAEAN